jgi:coenzyme PQQ synthesis protein D (PqqD)
MRKLPVPHARTNDLIIEELPDEMLVYDLNNNRAHCLNQTTAFVWKHCDGTKTLSEITHLLEDETNSPVDERLVRLALDLLSEHRLLDTPLLLPPVTSGIDRRKLVRTLALGALVAVPVITSIVAPTAAHAQSAPPQQPPA